MGEEERRVKVPPRQAKANDTDPDCVHTSRVRRGSYKFPVRPLGLSGLALLPLLPDGDAVAGLMRSSMAAMR